jgi:hypothetical protein
MTQNAAIADFKVAAPFIQPLIIPAFALAFNIGYFSAIDIGWFTFFNLSEHVVFALRALPIAIGASIGFEIGLRFHLIEHHLHLHKNWRIYIYYIWVTVLVIAMLVSERHHRFGLLISVGAVLVGAWIHHNLRTPKRSLIEVLYWATTLLFITMFVGYVSAYYFMPYQRCSNIVMTHDNDIVGNILFSGTKYLLIYEPGNSRTRIALWSDIGGVSLCP